MSGHTYANYRQRVFDEYTLIGHRLGWMLAAQSMLLTAFAIASTSGRDQGKLLTVIFIFGLLTAAGTLVSAIAAMLEIESLKRDYATNVSADERRQHPSLVGGGSRHWTGHFLTTALPLLVVLLWIGARTYVTPWAPT